MPGDFFYVIEDLNTGEVWGMNGWYTPTKTDTSTPTWDTEEEANVELAKLGRGTVERYDLRK